MNIEEIPLTSILAPRLQPRLDELDDTIDELASSIRRHGLISPLSVAVEEDGYRLLAGNRRLKALRQLAWETAPCIVLDITDDEGDQITLAENLFRRDLSPVEEALAFALFIQETECTHEELADYLGKERTYVTRRLLLLDLDDQTLGALEDGLINLTQALLLRQVADTDTREMFIEHAVEYGANVRVMQIWVANYQKEQARARAGELPPEQAAEYTVSREVFMACDRCAKPTSYDLLRPVYLCPECRRVLAAFRAAQGGEK